MKEMAAWLNNNGIVISKALFDKTYLKYTNLFTKACYKLYDMGYLKSSSTYSEVELKDSYFNDFPDSVSLFESYNSGSIMFNWRVAELALLVGDFGDDFKKATTYVRDILKYRSALDALDETVSRLSLKKKSEVLVYPKIFVGTSIENNSKIPLDNFALQECFMRNPNTHLTSIDTRDELIKVLCQHIGVSDEEYTEHKSGGQAFFINGISAIEELSFVRYIVSCSIRLDGKYGQKLYDFVANYYQTHLEKQKERISCVKFEDLIYSDALSARNERVKQKCKDVKIIGGREFYITDDSAVFEVPNTAGEQHKYLFDDGFVVGNYVLDYITGMELDKSNCLLGLSGEFISREDVTTLGYSAVGKSLPMHTLTRTSNNSVRDSTVEYYPIYNVSKIPNLKKLEDVREFSLKPRLGNDIQFAFSDINDVYKQYGVSDKEGLFKTLRSYILSEFDLLAGASLLVGRKSYSSLVADLVCALIFMDCGYPDYELCFNSYEWVTEEIYLTACHDACVRLIQYYG